MVNIRGDAEAGEVDELRSDLETLLRDDGSLCLVAKRPKPEDGAAEQRKVFARKFTDVDSALAHLREHEAADTAGEMNFYVVRNPSGPGLMVGQPPNRRPPRAGQAGNPPRETDLTALRWLAIDIDPRGDAAHDEVRNLGTAALVNLGVPLWLVMDSGRGVQAQVRLAEPAENTPENRLLFKACAKALYKRVESKLARPELCEVDHVQNVNRQTRLAGTVNRKTGRRAAITHALGHEVPSLAALAELLGVRPEEARVHSAEATEVGSEFMDERLAELAANKGWAPNKLQADLLAEMAEVAPDVSALSSEGAARVEEFGFPEKGGRSEAEPKLARDLLEHGEPAAGVLGFLDQPGRHCADQDNTERALGRAAVMAVKATRLVLVMTVEEYAEWWVRERDDPEEFECDSKGKPYASQRNIRLALRQLGASVSYNEFTDQILIDGLDGFGPVLQDDAMERLWLATEEKFGFRPGREYYWTVVKDHARSYGFHPVRDYLDDLEWDGEARVDSWLVDYAGAEDTEYVRAVGRIFLLAAVRRVRQPGCKFDEMLVLESGQGLDKSSALSVLAVKEEWFSDDLPLTADSKRVIEQTAGRWIIEGAELKGMRQGAVEHLKAFLSRRVDRARMSYGRLTSERPREFVIVGTTNDRRYLRDRTGNRRFWPVAVEKFDIKALARDRDQLWAEAASREAQRESIRLNAVLWEAAGLEQSEREVEDPWKVTLEHLLGDMAGKLLIEEAWTLVERPSGQRTQGDNERLGHAMRELGFERKRLRHDGRLVYFYVRGGTEAERDRMILVSSKWGEVSAWVDTGEF